MKTEIRVFEFEKTVNDQEQNWNKDRYKPGYNFKKRYKPRCNVKEKYKPECNFKERYKLECNFKERYKPRYNVKERYKAVYNFKERWKIEIIIYAIQQTQIETTGNQVTTQAGLKKEK